MLPASYRILVSVMQYKKVGRKQPDKPDKIMKPILSEGISFIYLTATGINANPALAILMEPRCMHSVPLTPLSLE
jgi:hypothetical protein